MNRNRIIIAVVVFIFAGLMIYAFANPANTDNPSNGNDNQGATENNTEGDPNSNTDPNNTENGTGTTDGSGSGRNTSGMYETERTEYRESYEDWWWDPVELEAVDFKVKSGAGKLVVTKDVLIGTIIEDKYEEERITPNTEFSFTISGRTAQNAIVNEQVTINLADPQSEDNEIELDYGVYQIVESDNPYFEFSDVMMTNGHSLESIKLGDAKDENLYKFAVTAENPLAEFKYTNLGTDATVEKSVDNTSVYLDEIINYTVYIKNTGNTVLRAPQIEDTLSSNLEFKEITSVEVSDPDAQIKDLSYIYDNTNEADGVILLTLGDLNPGETAIIKYSVAVKSSAEQYQEVSNDVKVTAVNIYGERSDKTTTTLDDRVVMRLTKENNPDSDKKVEASEKIVYTLTITNSENAEARNVKIIDTLNDKINFTNTEPEVKLNGTLLTIGEDYTKNINGKKLTILLKSVPAGGIVTITYEVQVDKDAKRTEVVENIVLLTAENMIGELSGKTQNIIKAPIISASKDHNTTDANKIGNVIRGEEITYTITVNNTGDASASGVKVTDRVPEHTTLANTEGNYKISNGGTYNPTTKEITWSNISVLANNSVDLTFTVIVNDVSEEVTISNTANVEAKNTNTVRDKVLLPEIEAVKSADVEVVKKGDTITYSIKVTNIGDAISDPIKVIDNIPSNTTFLSVPSSSHAEGTLKTSSSKDECGDEIKYIEFDEFILAAGESETLVFKVKVNDQTCALKDGAYNKRETKIGDRIYNTAVVDDEDTNEVIVHVEGKVDVTIKSITTIPTDVVLVLDRSGSMNGTKMSDTKKAAKDLINLLLSESNISSVKVGVVTYGTNIIETMGGRRVTSSTLTNNPSTLNDYINNIPNSVGSGTGYDEQGTNIHSGLLRANELLGNTSDGRQKIVILLSDGIPTFYVGSNSKLCGNGTNNNQDNSSGCEVNGNNTPKSVANAQASAMKSNKIKIYTIGFNADTDAETFLKGASSNTASDTSYYYSSSNYSGLLTNFQSITEHINTRPITVESSYDGIVKFGTDEALVFNSSFPMYVKIGNNPEARVTTAAELEALKMSYDPITGILTWDIGDLLGGDSTISLAITYYVQ